MMFLLSCKIKLLSCRIKKVLSGSAREMVSVDLMAETGKHILKKMDWR